MTEVAHSLATLGFACGAQGWLQCSQKLYDEQDVDFDPNEVAPYIIDFIKMHDLIPRPPPPPNDNQ